MAPGLQHTASKVTFTQGQHTPQESFRGRRGSGTHLAAWESAVVWPRPGRKEKRSGKQWAIASASAHERNRHSTGYVNMQGFTRGLPVAEMEEYQRVSGMEEDWAPPGRSSSLPSPFIPFELQPYRLLPLLPRVGLQPRPELGFLLKLTEQLAARLVSATGQRVPCRDPHLKPLAEHLDPWTPEDGIGPASAWVPRAGHTFFWLESVVIMAFLVFFFCDRVQV